MLLCYCVRWEQLCSSLNILRHCLSLGLEWKLNKRRWGHGSLQRPLVACSTFISFSKTDYTFIIRWISVLSYKIFPRIPCICGAQWDINRSCLFSLFPSSFPPPCLEHRYDGWTSRCHFINKRTRLTPWGWQKVKVLVSQSCPALCACGAAAHQAPLSMEFSRQEY